MSETPTPRVHRRALLKGALALTLLATGGGTYALDRYVIDDVVISDVAAYEASHTAGAAAASTAASSSGALTSTSFTSDAASVQLSTVVSGTGTEQVTYFVADMQLSDATALRSAFAQNEFGTNITDIASSIAADNGAVFAVNGDYYGFRDDGIVIRNGVAYRDEGAREALAMYRDGHVEVYDETTTTADQLVGAGVWNTLSFGPALLIDGQVQTDLEDVAIDSNLGNRTIDGDNPRTAVGVIDDNHLVFIVVDGRQDDSAGVSLTELAEIFEGLGAKTAYNLDGGGSSTMVFDDQLVNDPQGRSEERAVSDILYIAGSAS